MARITRNGDSGSGGVPSSSATSTTTWVKRVQNAFREIKSNALNIFPRWNRLSSKASASSPPIATDLQHRDAPQEDNSILKEQPENMPSAPPKTEFHAEQTPPRQEPPAQSVSTYDERGFSYPTVTPNISSLSSQSGKPHSDYPPLITSPSLSNQLEDEQHPKFHAYPPINTPPSLFDQLKDEKHPNAHTHNSSKLANNQAKSLPSHPLKQVVNASDSDQAAEKSEDPIAQAPKQQISSHYGSPGQPYPMAQPSHPSKLTAHPRSPSLESHAGSRATNHPPPYSSTSQQPSTQSPRRKRHL